ncbi:phosphate-starvation-inducible protein PsiE [Paenibacillus sp. HN-1]|uniref:phosphate-starvation-inducible protein PsiE n=1 Tax=Paenibacillus TaxID=44249 RepID=UPI001CA88FC0|nr:MULTISPECIES: phosphate-starvation-inducible protein PsiE [Paenibacillus]MBY9078360.1 phosphate-starvation-inducible protein PsiE [Paenibacillus sp. CGMCC 1.18879]MBY9087307.1 phosphate-starvation-inducible protein PsiE [Paenibacillus sinensis]
MKIKSKVAYIPLILQWTLNASLVVLAVILVVLLGKETYLIFGFINDGGHLTKLELLEALLIYFLYFEFIALIIKYFEAHYHFPLRYFVYIGITAIIRLIIIDHETPMDTLLYAGAILVLVITLYIANSKLLKRES